MGRQMHCLPSCLTKYQQPSVRLREVIWASNEYRGSITTPAIISARVVVATFRGNTPGVGSGQSHSRRDSVARVCFCGRWAAGYARRAGSSWTNDSQVTALVHVARDYWQLVWYL